MKGTDCTPQQIEAARRFLAGRSGHPLDDDDQRIAFTVGDLVRAIAWYGAVRFIACRDGDGGTLDAPGELVVLPKEPA